MRLIRRLMGWIFGVSSFLCVWGFGYLIVLGVRQRRSYDLHRLLSSHQSGILLLILLFIVMFPVLAAVFGAAFWTTLNQKPTARGWGIAGSLVYVLAPVWPIIQHPGSVFGVLGIELAIGIVGLAAFALSPGVKREVVDLPPESKYTRKA